MDWDWEDIFLSIFVIVLLLGVVTIGTFIFSTKTIDYYYLATSQSTNGVCVQQHWAWNQDQHAYCTDDVNKAIDVLTKLNATIKK